MIDVTVAVHLPFRVLRLVLLVRAVLPGVGVLLILILLVAYFLLGGFGDRRRGGLLPLHFDRLLIVFARRAALDLLVDLCQFGLVDGFSRYLVLDLLRLLFSRGLSGHASPLSPTFAFFFIHDLFDGSHIFDVVFVFADGVGSALTRLVLHHDLAQSPLRSILLFSFNTLIRLSELFDDVGRPVIGLRSWRCRQAKNQARLLWRRRRRMESAVGLPVRTLLIHIRRSIGCYDLVIKFELLPPIIQHTVRRMRVGSVTDVGRMELAPRGSDLVATICGPPPVLRTVSILLLSLGLYSLISTIFGRSSASCNSLVSASAGSRAALALNCWRMLVHAPIIKKLPLLLFKIGLLSLNFVLIR